MTVSLMRQLRDEPDETQRIDLDNASTEENTWLSENLEECAFMEMEQVFKIHSTQANVFLPYLWEQKRMYSIS